METANKVIGAVFVLMGVFFVWLVMTFVST